MGCLKLKHKMIKNHLLVMMVLFVCFQNFDFAKILNGESALVNEDARLAHAQELIGSQWIRSPALFASMTIPDLSDAMYLEVRKALPKSYKNKAWKITSTIIEESAKYQMDPVFVMAMIKAESHFNPKAKGSVGELGLMQIRPETAHWFTQVEGIPFSSTESLYDPETNIKIGVAYVNYLRGRFDSDPRLYLPAYNMGARKVKKMISKDKRPRVYAQRVMKKYKETYKSLLAKDSQERPKKTPRYTIVEGWAQHTVPASIRNFFGQTGQ